MKPLTFLVLVVLLAGCAESKGPGSSENDFERWAWNRANRFDDYRTDLMASNDQAVLDAVNEGGAIEFTWPPGDHVFQQDVHVANIDYSTTIKDDTPIHVELVDASGAIAASSDLARGTFPAIPEGVYALRATSGLKTAVQTVSVGDLYLVAGQSNAMSPPEGHAPYVSATSLLFVQDVYRSEDPRSLFLPTQSMPATSSIAWSIAGDLLAASLHRPIGFINIAMGSTRTIDWEPEQDTLINGFDDVLKTTRVRAILWVQGETDASTGVPYDESFSAMRKIVQYTRALQPGVDWYVAPDSATTLDAPIRLAQGTLIREGLVKTGPDADKVRAETGSGTHFNPAGLDAFGRAWAGILSQLN
jgi:hypothetical protein